MLTSAWPLFVSCSRQALQTLVSFLRNKFRVSLLFVVNDTNHMCFFIVVADRSHECCLLEKRLTTRISPRHTALFCPDSERQSVSPDCIHRKMETCRDWIVYGRIGHDWFVYSLDGWINRYWIVYSLDGRIDHDWIVCSLDGRIDHDRFVKPGVKTITVACSALGPLGPPPPPGPKYNWKLTDFWKNYLFSILWKIFVIYRH